MAVSDKFKNAPKTSEEIEEALDSLEKLLDRTKVMYEQYFMGIQKLPPNQLHKDLDRRIRDLTQEQIRNTGLRFRFATLQQKLGSYNSYWRRVMRQIEQGSYVRDVARVSRKAARTGAEMPEELLVKLPKRMQDKIRRDRAMIAEAAVRSGRASNAPPPTAPSSPTRPRPDSQVAALAGMGDDDFDTMFDNLTRAGEDAPALPAKSPEAAAPRAAPALRETLPQGGQPARPSPAPRAATPTGSPPPPGMSERQARELYDRYMRARELVGQGGDGMTYEKLMGSLGKQASGIMQQHGARGVEFNVVVKGDKVVLKAKPQK